jgi:hypothetical protein
MRQRQRRDAAREWVRTGTTVTVKSYAKRYGVDRYTAYDDLTAIGFPLPESAQQWSQRPPATPCRTAGRGVEEPDNDGMLLDGTMFFVVGYTSGGAPYGILADEVPDEV